MYLFSVLQYTQNSFRIAIPYHCEKQICKKSSRFVCSNFFLWSNSIHSSLFKNYLDLLSPPPPKCGYIICNTVGFIYVYIKFVFPHSHLFIYSLNCFLRFNFQKLASFLNFNHCNHSQSFRAYHGNKQEKGWTLMLDRAVS